MSIADGRKVAIKFSQPLIGNVDGLNPPAGYKKVPINLSNAIVTSLNQYSSSYKISNAIDGDLTTLWWGSTVVNWIKVQFAKPEIVTRIRMYLGSCYVETFTFSGSNDGEVWTQIGDVYTAAKSSTSQWYDIDIENNAEYLYYKIDTLTSGYSGRVYIYELELCEDVPIGNETKFTVSFDEYNFVPGGSTSKVTRPVNSIENHCSLNTIIDLSNGVSEKTEYTSSGISLTMKEAE